MDIEFHYYLTYLIAAKAGFSADEAEIIAHSCQMTDDNTAIFEINKDKNSDSSDSYSNYISQTSDITKPRHDLMRIYSHFHFLPGDPDADSAKRKDGKTHWLNTTPASKNADKMFLKALNTRNLFRIGIACHVYADTFAHQNFVGDYDDFNCIHTILGSEIPYIGHLAAFTYPDWPAYIWTDDRLIDGNIAVYNRQRFLDAAVKLYEYLAAYKFTPQGQEITDIKANLSQSQLDTIKNGSDRIYREFDKAINEIDIKNYKKDERITNYKRLSLYTDFGSKTIPNYDEDDWINKAVTEDVLGLKIKYNYTWNALLPFPEKFHWADLNNYKNSNWYNFQEAIKNHQNETWDILKDENFANVNVKNL